MAKRGFGDLMIIALTMVLGVILIFNVILPVTNTAMVANTNGSNLGAYTGAMGVGQASYIILVLCLLSLAAGTVVAFYGALVK